MTTTLSGGCACGAVRYDCFAQPLMAFNCHCRCCQHASGSAFASILVVPSAQFIERGQLKYHPVQANSGNTMLRGFCPDCGSPVLIKEPHRRGIVLIQAASLDDPSAHQPAADIYTSRAHPWDYMNPALAKFPEMPPLPPLPE